MSASPLYRAILNVLLHMERVETSDLWLGCSLLHKELHVYFHTLCLWSHPFLPLVLPVAGMWAPPEDCSGENAAFRLEKVPHHWLRERPVSKLCQQYPSDYSLPLHSHLKLQMFQLWDKIWLSQKTEVAILYPISWEYFLVEMYRIALLGILFKRAISYSLCL